MKRKGGWMSLWAICENGNPNEEARRTWDGGDEIEGLWKGGSGGDHKACHVLSCAGSEESNSHFGIFFARSHMGKLMGSRLTHHDFRPHFTEPYK